MKTATIILIAILAAASSPTHACDDNFDCEIGSKCVRGACVGGLWPGNDNDRAPLRGYDRPTWDLNDTYGDTCQFDIDCGPGMKCAKGGNLEGACVRAH